MSWYDPTSWGDTAKNVLNAVVPVSALYGGTQGSAAQTIFGDPGQDAERQRKEQLYAQAAAAGQFAGQGQNNYNWATEQGRGALAGLQRLASGQDSVSAEQLRQALGQTQAQQASMAAGASPQNAAMAARTAAIQSGRLGAGLAGQQAIAGLAERNQAQQQYGGLLQGLRGQDLQASLGSRQNALTGYGAANAGAPEKSWLEKYGPAIQSGAALAMSDRRVKKGVRSGEVDAAKAMRGLKSYSFEYKDPKHGEGRRFGSMTDNLKRAGLGHAVIKTPEGEAVHGGHLAASLAAMMPGISKRLDRLETRK